MVFSSHIFLFYFLPLTLALYYISPQRLRMPVLTLMSYAFYGWANPWFVLILLWSTMVDYCCGNFISGHWGGFRVRTSASSVEPGSGFRSENSGTRRLFLVLSLLSNIGLLCFFKYLVFAEENLNRMLLLLGRQQLQILQVALPVGISFYTFESISYNVDIFLGRAKPAIAWVESSGVNSLNPEPRTLNPLKELRAFNAFACYITQFPHLVAGPIIRYQDLQRQLHQRTHTLEKFARGVFFFALGMAKKVLIANSVGQIADKAFSAGSLCWTDAWYGLFAYGFQIYFDFSGYSDMAIGLGLMFGFEFAKNFDSPYKSQSITEFWRRWHISLSTWLRDYLYIPLGGNRLGLARTYLNLLVVMLIGGLWHGASWNFLVWGGIHGLWLALERPLGKTSFYGQAPRALRVAITFLIVSIAWVFFRAEDLPSAIHYCGHLLGLTGHPPAVALLSRAIFFSSDHVLAMIVAGAVAFFGMQTWDLARRITPPRAALAMLLLGWSIIALAAQSYNPFLYFRF